MRFLSQVESVRVNIVSRPRFSEPDLGDLMYAWDAVERRVERRVRELVRRRVQVRVEDVLRNLVEGESEAEDGVARRSAGGGRQLFNL